MKKTKLFSLSVILQVLFICSLNAQNPVLSFDGVDDYVSLGTSAGNGIRTIEMWFKPGIGINPLLNDKMVLAAREESLDNYDEFNLHFIDHGNTNAGKLCFFISVGPGTSNYYYVISDSDTWNAGQWYHVASVIHPSQGMMMFIDGVKQADTNSYVFATAHTSDYTMLGCQGDAFTRFFNGSIDDVRFSSDAQYLSNFTPPCPDLLPDTSTIALWNLNENSGNIVYDTSTNQYYGIINGANWDISNICDTLGGNALYFDGIDDYVDLGPDAGNGVRTMELWFSPANKIDNSISDYAALVARNNGLSNEHEITLAFSGASGSKGKLYFGIKDSNGNQSLIFSDSDSWDADKWYHVAAVIDPLQGMRMFIDGVKQMDTNSYTSATTNFTTITSVGSWGDTLVRLFNGRIDDVRFSSEAMYTSNFIPPCPDLMSNNFTIGLWNFNESGGTIAYDSSMNSYNGQIVGATRIYANICDTIPGGNALYFDGIDDYVDLGPDVGNGVRTIELWFRLEVDINPNLNTYITLMGREESLDNYDEFNIHFQHSSMADPGTLCFFLSEDISNYYYVISDNNTWIANEWYHLAAVIHPVKGMMLFINGIKQADTNSYTLAAAYTSDLTMLGCQGDAFMRFFNGSIDDVRFSSEAKYTSDFTPPCPDLMADTSTIGLWNFNENSGTIAYDSSGHSYDGILYGASRINAFICEDTIITAISDLFPRISNSFISVYPNPSENVFTFDFNSNTNADFVIEIFDYLGKLISVKYCDQNSVKVDLNSVNRGIYLYRIRENERIIKSGKLIRQ